jgi:large subunit ribosomal protein L6
MSRIGKKPLSIPKGVEVSVSGRIVTVKGAKGTLTQEMHPTIGAVVENNEVVFTPTVSRGNVSPVWGAMQSLVGNMIEGVTNGYTVALSLVGVGYRATAAGNKLNMTLGYSHPIEMPIPQGLAVDVKDQTAITITGINKHLVGQFAAKVRDQRKPEPFKGKGVRYANEHIVMKEGKKK